jgi:hypothetical protein
MDDRRTVQHPSPQSHQLARCGDYALLTTPEKAKSQSTQQSATEKLQHNRRLVAILRVATTLVL